MRSHLPLTRRAAAAAAAVGLLGAGLVATATTPASAEHRAPAARVTSVTLHPGGADRTVGFHRAHAGEAFLDVTVSAPGVSWARNGHESAVVSAYVDGHYATDIVISSATRVPREFALGSLRAGHHTLRLHYADVRSPVHAGVARLRDIAFRTVRPGSPAYAAAAYAPVLRGRDVPGLGGRFQNNRTDSPLVAWHEVSPAAKPGHSVIEYSVVWSNEDGGTPAPALMAQWGRTTDVEWIYRVEVTAQGRRVPGTGVFQSPNHGTEKFRGTYDGTHPVLQTCTSNNNVCDAKALAKLHQKADPMRFALSTRDGLPAGQPREHLMDTHPWTYQVMAREMLREHKVAAGSAATSFVLGDQRRYLYLALDQAPSDSTVGLAVDVTLTDHRTFSSDHAQLPLLYTVHRSGPAATTVKLPAGTTPADIASIAVRRVTPLLPGGTDDGASITVSAIVRAFFLGPAYLPRASFAQGPVSATLTQASPTAVIWTPAP